MYPGTSHTRRPIPDEEQPSAPQWQRDMQSLIDKFEVNEAVAFGKKNQGASNKDDNTGDVESTGEIEDVA